MKQPLFSRRQFFKLSLFGVGAAAQFRWSVVATQVYSVQWRAVGELTWQSSSTVSLGYSGTYWSSITTGLSPSVAYEWRVMSHCDGVLTPSSSRTFVAQCVVPVPQAYYDLSSRAAYVYWNGYSGVAGVAYRVRWRQVGTTSWTESTTTSNTSMPITGLANATTYEWQVQCICDGTPTGYSPNGINFTTRCPTPYLNRSVTMDIGANLSWSTFVGEAMDLRYRVAGSPIWTTITSLTTGSYNLTGLTPTTAYEWQVLVNCQGGQTIASSVGTFTTLAGCDPNEPNNTTLTATAIPVNATSYSTVGLCLNIPSDNDWFRWEMNGQVYYILVFPFAYNTTGPYSLSLSFASNVLKINTLSVNGIATDTYLHLYAANGTTLLAQNDDSNGRLFSEITYTLPVNCTAMTTIKAGLWTDPTVWSCGRVPVSTDAVQVLHEVSMPISTTGNAGRVTYGVGGKVIMNTGARLVLGQ